MPLNFQYTFLVIAAGALLVSGRWRRLSLVGLVPLGLAVAATTVRMGAELSGLALKAAERSVSLGFLQLNTGLVVLGIVLVGTGVVGSVVGAGRSPLAWVAVFLVGAGVAPLLAAQLPLLAYIGWLPTVGAAAGIAAGSVLLFFLGRLLRISRAVNRLDHALLDRHPPGLVPAGHTSLDLLWVTGFLASSVIMVITPSLRAFVLATVVAATVGHALMRRLGGGSPIPVTAVFALFIIPGFQLLRTVAGDPAPAMGDLVHFPLSAAAEIRIVPWLAVAAWGLSGLWPLHGLSSPLVAPLSGIVLIRLGATPLPDAMAHWSPLFIPLALPGVGHVVAARRSLTDWPRRLIEMLVALAFLGAFAGGEGVAGAWWLVGAAALAPWIAYPLHELATRHGMARIGWLPLAWGALLVITGGLASQVTYTVLAAGGIAAGLWVYHSPE